MKINIIQTITNILDEDRKLIKTSLTEAYVLTPDSGKVLKHIITGKVYTNSISLGNKNQVKDYIEVDL